MQARISSKKAETPHNDPLINAGSIYGISRIRVVALFAFSAQAKTITLKATANDAVYYLDQTNGNAVAITTEGVAYSVENEGSLIIKANTGWRITKVAQQPAGQSGQSFEYPEGIDSTEGKVVTYPFKDGSEVLVTVEQGAVQKPQIHITGTAGQYRVNFNYAEYTPDAGGKIDIDKENASLSIYANDNYRLTEVTANGENITIQNEGKFAQFYAGNYTGDLKVEVVTKAESEIEKGKFTVNVEGHAYKFVMYDANYNYTYFENPSTVVSFEEGASYTFSSQYSNLYEIKVNDEVVATSWDSYKYTPTNGDVVTITTEFPDIDVPVNFTFDGVDSGVISELRYDNNLVDASVWNVANWTCKLGKALIMKLNTADYANVKMTVNGKDVTPDYNGSINITLTEEKYDIVVSGERQEPYKVTIVVEDPNSLKIFKGYTQETFTLAGQETELIVKRNENALQFKAAEGFMLNGITVNGEAPAEGKFLNNMYYVEGDCTIEVDVAAIERPNTAVVYLENISWNYKSFTLSQSNYDLRKEVDLAPGYNFVKYGDFDLPFGIGGYPTPTVYLNNEELQNQYGAYPALANFKDGDVIKIYSSAQTPNAVTYTIADDVNVTVTHDHVTTIENPSTHNVLPGTQVHITPVTTFAAETTSPILVEVNNQNVSPNEDGRYTFTVDADTNVKVTKNTNTGIEDINAANTAEPTAVYNMQGIRVGESLKDLPSGIYIQNGKKVLVK